MNPVKPIRAVAVLAPACLAKGALAQGCALCNTQAQQSGAKMAHALNEGIVLMFVAPVASSALIAWLAYRKRNTFHRA